jgi:hypothetical protein
MCLTLFQILDLAYTGLSDLPEEFVQLPSIRHKLQLLYLNGNQFSYVPETLAALGKNQCLFVTRWKNLTYEYVFHLLCGCEMRSLSLRGKKL